MPSDELSDASIQDTDQIILLTPHSGGTACVDRVCEQLLAEFPGAVITAQNSFAAKRLYFEDFRKRSQDRLRLGTLEPWAWKTMDELNRGVDRLIAHNRRVELRAGPMKDLAIPLSTGTQLVGEVGAKWIRFQGLCRRSDVTLARLVRFLESLHIGKVEILELDPNPSCSKNLGQE